MATVPYAQRPYDNRAYTSRMSNLIGQRADALARTSLAQGDAWANMARGLGDAASGYVMARAQQTEADKKKREVDRIKQEDMMIGAAPPEQREELLGQMGRWKEAEEAGTRAQQRRVAGYQEQDYLHKRTEEQIQNAIGMVGMMSGKTLDEQKAAWPELREAMKKAMPKDWHGALPETWDEGTYDRLITTGMNGLEVARWHREVARDAAEAQRNQTNVATAILPRVASQLAQAAANGQQAYDTLVAALEKEHKANFKGLIPTDVSTQAGKDALQALVPQKPFEPARMEYEAWKANQEKGGKPSDYATFAREQEVQKTNDTIRQAIAVARATAKGSTDPWGTEPTRDNYMRAQGEYNAEARAIRKAYQDVLKDINDPANVMNEAAKTEAKRVALEERDAALKDAQTQFDRAIEVRRGGGSAAAGGGGGSMADLASPLLGSGVGGGVGGNPTLGGRSGGGFFPGAQRAQTPAVTGTSGVRYSGAQVTPRQGGGQVVTLPNGQQIVVPANSRGAMR